MQKKLLGFIGEKLAIALYWIRGYKAIHTRYRSKIGEIDAVLIRGKNIVFLEVKTRSSKPDLETIVSYKQKARIKRSAQAFLAQHSQFADYAPRIDLVIIRFGLPVIVSNAW